MKRFKLISTLCAIALIAIAPQSRADTSLAGQADASTIPLPAAATDTNDLGLVEHAGVFYKWSFANQYAYWTAQLPFLSNASAVPIVNGGTGATTASTARVSLGLGISGTDSPATVEPHSAYLTAVSAATLVQITNSGLGYASGTGVGATVSQGTNRSTAVTLNKLTGQITMMNTSLAVSTNAVFVVNDTLVRAADVVIVNISGPAAGRTGTPVAWVTNIVDSTSFEITVRNTHAATADTTNDVINFAIIKGSSN